MNTDLELTRYFVKVVQCGGFSKAAELLRVPKSTVSKSISRLEYESGTKLLLRTTRSVTPTAAGQAYYDSCAALIQSLEDAQKSLSGKDSLISGLVRVTAPEDLGGYVIAPALSGLIRKHSGLSFEMHYTDEVIDLVRQGFDLAVRIGGLSESGLKAKKLGEVILIMVASPDYLEANPKIRVPKDLENHDGLTFSRGLTEWWLSGASGRVKVRPRSRLLSNQMTSLKRSALAGAGVALLPHFICVGELESGRLQRILPSWSSVGLPVTLLSPLPMNATARIKATVDQMVSALQVALKFNG